MRTWKQGIVGEISLSHSTYLYVHCLKYPLVKVYREYKREHQLLNEYMFSIMLDKSVLKSINRIGELKLSKEEKNERDIFQFDSKENKIYLKNYSREENRLIEKLYKIEELLEKYNKAIIDLEK